MQARQWQTGETQHFERSDCSCSLHADIPCVKEPPGLSRKDGKRPDGLSDPLENRTERCWDLTEGNTLSSSYIGLSSQRAGSV